MIVCTPIPKHRKGTNTQNCAVEALRVLYRDYTKYMYVRVTNNEICNPDYITLPAGLLANMYILVDGQAH